MRLRCPPVDPELEARRRARLAWPSRVLRLGEEPPEEIIGSAEERIAAVWAMTLEAWAIAGKPLPTYERHETPIRVIHRSEDV